MTTSFSFIRPWYPGEPLATIHRVWYISRYFAQVSYDKISVLLPRSFSSESILKERIRINQSIRSLELRVIGADGANLGVIPRDEAMRHARGAGLDLIEISPNARS